MYITQAKPNPAGKDKTSGHPKPDHLIGEWVDIKNNGSAPIDLGRVSVAHTEYDHQERPHPKPKIYWKGKSGSYLAAGATLRLHAGKESQLHLAHRVDIDGADMHVFSEEEAFVLNNEPGDVIYVYVDGKLVDHAAYQHAEEGAILVREGDKLVNKTGHLNPPKKNWTQASVVGTGGKSA